MRKITVEGKQIQVYYDSQRVERDYFGKIHYTSDVIITRDFSKTRAVLESKGYKMGYSASKETDFFKWDGDFCESIKVIG